MVVSRVTKQHKAEIAELVSRPTSGHWSLVSADSALDSESLTEAAVRDCVTASPKASPYDHLHLRTYSYTTLKLLQSCHRLEPQVQWDQWAQ